jgi:hypothetical protein
MHVGLCVKYLLFMSDFNEVSRQSSKKYSSMKFYGNPSSGSRELPCGQTDRQTDMAKLIVTFRNFEKAPKNAINLTSFNIYIYVIKQMF